MYWTKFCFLLCFYAITVPWMYSCDAIFSQQLENNENSEEIESNVRMIFYNGSSRTAIESYGYRLYESKELMNLIDLHKPYILYVHGFEEHPSNESVRTIISAYLQRGTDNIVLLDWSALAFENYVSVYLRLKDIAKHTARAMEKLAAEGLNTHTLHLIGHSMGAHLAGFVGKYLHFTVPRVTGLDPANPLFYQFGADHLNKKSGLQVDVIHTDGGLYGAYESTGSVDFFPNGGIRPQPGCNLFGLPLSPRGLCSHWRSWRFYAESVINNTAFPALRCSSYGSFQLGHCEHNKVVYLGYALPKDITGIFFLKTNDMAPFGKGIEGTKN